MVRGFLKNCCKPQGLMGRFVVRIMNAGHKGISEWGLSHLNVAKDAVALDIGCGGGANVQRLLRMCPEGRVEGIDYSEESVRVSRRKNARMLGERCDIRLGSVDALPYEDGTFDIAIAFETVYFWPDLEKDFPEVRRVLREGGIFLMCNDAGDPSDDTWSSRIEGMRIYSKEDLTDTLSRNGFAGIRCDTHPNGWICVSAGKKEPA
jgi:ubiquinone/menaquinone biosynthesis C-methylase UbiE